MHDRPLSVIGQGCWWIGAEWGEATDDFARDRPRPPAIYRDDRGVDALAADVRIAAWGVSVGTREEVLISPDREHLTSIQIILNLFRLKPLDQVIPAAEMTGEETTSTPEFARCNGGSGTVSVDGATIGDAVVDGTAVCLQGNDV